MKKNFRKLTFAFAMVLASVSVMADDVTVLSLKANDDATLSGMSNNGKWAVGYAFDNSDNAATNINAITKIIT